MSFISEYKPLAQARSHCPHFPAKETEAKVWGAVGGGDEHGRGEICDLGSDHPVQLALRLCVLSQGVTNSNAFLGQADSLKE